MKLIHGRNTFLIPIASPVCHTGPRPFAPCFAREVVGRCFFRNHLVLARSNPTTTPSARTQPTLPIREEPVLNIFDELESNVRYYCRRWPTVFTHAEGAVLTDEHGTDYLDFFAGAGALNFGHNNPVFVDIAIDHLRSRKLLHSLDTFTAEKAAFLEAVTTHLLTPRHLDMVVQTVGPTGATAIEAALQLAFRLTGKHGVIGYVGGYHGMSLRAASVSESMAPRPAVARVGDFVALPFVELVSDADLELLETTLRAGINGEPIGAILIEPTQGEGGCRPFDPAYLAAVRELATRYDAIVIADEIQAGVGRTGPFFSHEGTGLDPDVITVSKSISGLGLPMAFLLVRSSLDTWRPGEFSGTFRGNNLAFATSAAMLSTYWRDDHFQKNTERQGAIVRDALSTMVETFGPSTFKVQANGMFAGLNTFDTAVSEEISRAAFRRQLIVEVCGRGDTVVKLLPTLIMTDDQLVDGLTRLHDAVAEVVTAQ